jgi:hypothetical protein
VLLSVLLPEGKLLARFPAGSRISETARVFATDFAGGLQRSSVAPPYRDASAPPLSPRGETRRGRGESSRQITSLSDSDAAAAKGTAADGGPELPGTPLGSDGELGFLVQADFRAPLLLLSLGRAREGTAPPSGLGGTVAPSGTAPVPLGNGGTDELGPGPPVVPLAGPVAGPEGGDWNPGTDVPPGWAGTPDVLLVPAWD